MISSSNVGNAGASFEGSAHRDRPTPRSLIKRAVIWYVRWLLPPLIGLTFFIPILYMVSQSLNEPRVPPPTTLNLIPSPAYFSNYVDLFREFPLAQPFTNSLFVEAVAVPLTLITASLAGFAMSQLQGKTRQRLLFTTIALMLVPLPALWVPRFVLFRNLGLTDQLLSLATPALMGSQPFFVLVFYWTFRRLPQALFEAARLDGATIWQVWRLVALPLAKPSLAVVSVLAFTMYWNDYMSPLMYLQQIPKYTIALRMQLFQGGDVTLLPLQMAGVVVSILPVIVLFLLVQRFFWPEGRAKGVTLGE